MEPDVSRPSQARGKLALMRESAGARQCPDNGHNLQELCRRELGEIVTVPRRSALLIAAIAGCAALTPLCAHAQWWSRGPADFEECADKAEKAATKEARTSALAECNAKFAGRRKPGGGYTYFDFMQNRSFDIAGPNPTPQEQKQIDQQYIVHLDRQRRSNALAEFTAKQQQQQEQLQQATFRAESEKTPLPREKPKPPAATNDLRSRTKTANCAQHSFSCEWPRLSESINELKKALFGPPPRNPEIPSRKKAEAGR
jgi:hypothetical protein